MKSTSNKQFLAYMSIAVFTLLLSLTGISFASWQIIDTQSTTNTVMTGCFSVLFTEDTTNGAVINLSATYPMSDEKGKALKPYIFTIKNTCNLKVKFDVTLDIKNSPNTTIDLSKVKVYLSGSATVGPSFLNTTTNVPFLETAVPDPAAGYSKAFIILSDTVDALNASKTYKLNLWVDESATLDNVPAGSKLTARLSVTSQAYQ